MKITIINQQDIMPVDEGKVREAIKQIPLPQKFKLSVVYLNDEEMAEMHLRYLKKEGPTDVLAFPLENNYGEVVVSAETALEEAKAREIEPEGELLLYTIHGTLHLLGYDDKTEEEAKKMHAREKEIITGLGYKWDWD